MSKFTERKKKERQAARAARRAEEREAARAEQLREQELERQRELDREAAREEERRQEAVALARELEAASQKAAALRQRYRIARRSQRRQEQRASQRIADLLNAARQAQRAEQSQAQRQEEQAGQRRQAARNQNRTQAQAEERRTEGQEENCAQARQQAQRQAQREQQRQEQREETRAAHRQEQARKERQQERQEEQRDAQSAAQRDVQRAEQRAQERQQAERQAARQQASREQARAQAAGAQAAAREETARPRPRGQRLPAGAISGDLPWLHVAGRYLLDERDNPLTLRGVTLRGYERAAPEGINFRPPASPGELQAIAGWGANAVLVPISQDLALEGRDEAIGEDYLAVLDELIAAASAAGLYTILQLALISSQLPTSVGPAGDEYDPALPEAESIDLWAILAGRYSGEPAVIFDLFQSPHAPGRGDSTQALLTEVTWPVWNRWLLAMLGEVRREHPRSLVIARGLRRGADLSGFPLVFTDGTIPGNIIYAAELRPTSGENGLRTLERLGRTHSVGIFTWLALPTMSLAVTTVGSRLARLGYHWIAGDWRGSRMPLVAQRGTAWVPTQLGRAFQTAMGQPAAPSMNTLSRIS